MLAVLTERIVDPGDRFTRDITLFSALLIVTVLPYGVWELRPATLKVEIKVEGQRGAETWVQADLDGGHASRAYSDHRACRLNNDRCSIAFSWPRGRRSSAPTGPAPSTLSLTLNNGQDNIPLGGTMVRAPSGAPVRLMCRPGVGCSGVQ